MKTYKILGIIVDLILIIIAISSMLLFIISMSSCSKTNIDNTVVQDPEEYQITNNGFENKHDRIAKTMYDVLIDSSLVKEINIKNTYENPTTSYQVVDDGILVSIKYNKNNQLLHRTYYGSLYHVAPTLVNNVEMMCHQYNNKNGYTIQMLVYNDDVYEIKVYDYNMHTTLVIKL